MDVSHEDEDVRQYNEDINLRHKLSSDWMKMLQNESFNDVCIKLHDGEVFANKVVLSARSEYFAASLRWKESNKEKKDAKHEIIFEHCSMKIMTLVIEYFYSGVLKVNDLTIMELFELREQVRILLPGDQLNKIIEEAIQEERFEELNIIELLELREKLRTLLPAEEFLLKDYMDCALYDVIVEEDGGWKGGWSRPKRFQKSFFLTNKEVLALIKSNKIQDRQRIIEICELFKNEWSEMNTSRCQAMLASLVFHGALKSIEELYIKNTSISLIPGDQLEALISSTTNWIEIYDDDNNFKTSDREIIFANVRSKVVEIVDMDLSRRETELLVSSMGSGVEEINLAGTFDAKEFLKYQGNGKCRRIDIYSYSFNKEHKPELLAWCRENNWSMTKKKGATRQYGPCSGIELKRKES